MEDWIERVISEHADLSVKVLKLREALRSNSASVFNKGDNMYELMNKQYDAMVSYRSILQQRINLITRR